MARLLRLALALAFSLPAVAVHAADDAAKEKDAAKTEKKKVRRPTPEQTEAEMAFFNLPESVRLTYPQRLKLHEIAQDSAPAIEAQMIALQKLNAQNKQYALTHSARRGGATMPDYNSVSGKLKKELGGQQKEVKDKILAMLTEKQRVQIDPSLKNYKPEDSADKKHPAKKDK